MSGGPIPKSSSGLDEMIFFAGLTPVSFDGTPELDPAFQVCLTSAEKRGCNTSLDPLAMHICKFKEMFCPNNSCLVYPQHLPSGVDAHGVLQTEKLT